MGEFCRCSVHFLPIGFRAGRIPPLRIRCLEVLDKSEFESSPEGIPQLFNIHYSSFIKQKKNPPERVLFCEITCRRGSDATAAGGGRRELSEWQRSVCNAGAPSARRTPGTATGSSNNAVGIVHLNGTRDCNRAKKEPVIRRVLFIAKITCRRVPCPERGDPPRSGTPAAARDLPGRRSRQPPCQ